MVIRHLFRRSISGRSAHQQSHCSESPFLAEGNESAAQAVADHIQFGIESDLLDVDRDGQTTALGDGLMVIRHLFGGAFRGKALIGKAISLNPSLLGGQELNDLSNTQYVAIASQVANTIETLIGVGLWPINLQANARNASTSKSSLDKRPKGHFRVRVRG